MGRERIQLLDGGMGTTLESSGYEVSSELWGSELLYTDPKAISDIHEGYVKSGAELIETSTYQLNSTNLSSYLSSSTSLTRSECARESSRILRTSVDLVHQSLCSSSESSESSSSTKPKSKRASYPGAGVVFSCGPYGSSLRPGAEYSGLYPPPYGPSLTTNSFPSSPITPSNTPPPPSKEEEEATELLSNYHLSKLMTVATHEDTWRKIDWIAFETIPVLHEIKAIRRTMNKLQGILRERYPESFSSSDAGQTQPQLSDAEECERESQTEWYNKKYWITCAFPNGLHPQHVSNSSSDSNSNLDSSSNHHVSVRDLVNVLLDEQNDQSIPNGIGINCTNPLYLCSLIKQFNESTGSHNFTQTEALNKNKNKDKGITFVLYPDGGLVYDVNTRTWSTPSNGPSNASEWAKGIYEVVQSIESAKSHQGTYIWDGVIVGGCCKTSFEEISALRKLIDQ
ncbi:uncharacterized protein IL334_001551 [Kwoniella shivajii]|uniref:Hcy-binding domain-containing protein n=1 Tax=Kwoniella shivajii TaxID=564305 RepID=A0ABZ1CSW0_9TREE|nr:hypothetical protein IL334_001551 [Kwoniella shivajii]